MPNQFLYCPTCEKQTPDSSRELAGPRPLGPKTVEWVCGECGNVNPKQPPPR